VRICEVHQDLVSRPLADIVGEVRRQLDGATLDVPSGEVAVTAGSRGIANIPVIVKAVGDWLRDRGARPFVVPCMGSHNGATAEGQRQMIESLGITEQAVGMEIRAGMDVVKLGTVATGDVYIDRHCFESDGVLVVNRVKLHTRFAGPVQSGLTKMMVVGMGKIRSARTFHSAATPQMKEMLLDMGRVIVESGKILGGLAILEDGLDQTAELRALRPEQILAREPDLLERHRGYFPRLPVDDLNVLVVDEIGKIYSGTGMDTNVVGYRGVKYGEDLDTPRIGIIAALGLAEGSHGNALGIGLADFVTRRLRDAMDERKTLTNVLTTGVMERIKIPATLETDEALIELVRDRFGDERWMFIPNTLHLERLFVSEDLAGELRSHPGCRVAASGTALAFDNGRCTLWA
jgi:hypothetical protein